MFLLNKLTPFLLILILFILLSCNESKDDAQAVLTDSTYESNRDKAKELQEIYQKIDPQDVEYHDNNRRADYFKNLATKPNLTMPQKMVAEINVGYELLMAGKNSNAIVELEKSLARLQAIGTQKKLEHSLKRLIALSYMRIGEQQNCINKFNKDACIFPIEGGGVYKMRQAPETAISIYKEILKEYPDDEESKWMLNIAYMTLGEYPKSVPEEYLVPPNTLESEAAFSRFINIADKVSLSHVGLCGGAIIEDFDNDGKLDIAASAWGLKDQMRVFKNTGSGFEDVTSSSDLIGQTSGLNMIHCDYNNDGLKDIFVLRGAWYANSGRIPNSLLQNIGNFKFKDVIIEVGLGEKWPTQSAVWTDFNNDGFLDILAASYDLKYLNVAGITNRELRGESTEGAKLFLLENNGDGTFTNIAEQAGIDKTLYVMGSNYGDLDNDGYLDMYLATGAPSYTALVPNKLYKNHKGKKFYDVTTTSRTGHLQKGHGVSFGDIDNDGDEDIFHVLGGAFSGDIAFDAVFQNTVDDTNNWINLELVGTISNKAAIGARVKVLVAGIEGDIKEIYRQVSTGSSFGSNSLNLEIGLGRIKEIKEIEIVWPNKQHTKQTFTAVQPNTFYKIIEGQSELIKKDIELLAFSDKKNL